MSNPHEHNEDLDEFTEDRLIESLHEFVNNKPVEFEIHGDLENDGKIWVTFTKDYTDGD
tara:strand:- start:194 stop:370 length:177 start_codon:yes stop_codon:yes gene_type:complete